MFEKFAAAAEESAIVRPRSCCAVVKLAVKSDVTSRTYDQNWWSPELAGAAV
ncbi:MAG: hypothetical protein HC882_08265 [Acidobacteria bacterium]|nr:hypothetical protein [Acidobacteriota bacterium]